MFLSFAFNTILRYLKNYVESLQNLHLHTVAAGFINSYRQKHLVFMCHKARNHFLSMHNTGSTCALKYKNISSDRLALAACYFTIEHFVYMVRKMVTFPVLSQSKQLCLYPIQFICTHLFLLFLIISKKVQALIRCVIHTF